MLRIRVAGRQSSGSHSALESGEARRRLDRMYPYEYYSDVFTGLQTQEFQDWLDALRDRRAQARIAARIRLAEQAISAI